jgi:hypothetical protein
LARRRGFERREQGDACLAVSASVRKNSVDFAIEFANYCPLANVGAQTFGRFGSLGVTLR